MSVVLACERKPPSTNNEIGKGREDFGREIARCYREVGEPKLEGLLYGIVFWFVRRYRPDSEPDADNISKGIWDLLSAPKRNDAPGRPRLGVYGDDKQVRLRIAGIIDLSDAPPDAPEIEQLALPPLPEGAAESLERFIEDKSARYFTYIECGSLRAGMFRADLLGEGS